MVGSGLRKVVGPDYRARWDLSFVVFYARKPDGSERYVVERFDMEALMAPFAMARRPRKAPRRHRIGVCHQRTGETDNTVASVTREALSASLLSRSQIGIPGHASSCPARISAWSSRRSRSAFTER